MQFKGLEKNSLIEWPGKAVTLTYTGGCNFRCPYCQNKDLVLDPEKIPSIDGEEIIEHLNSKKKWLDGLMVSGGEPTIHRPLLNFAQRVKKEGFEFGIETNGSNPEMLEDLLGGDLLDRCALDIKAPLNGEKYKAATGTDDGKLPEKVEKSMNLLRESEVSYEYRTTVVPKLLVEKDLIDIGKEIQETENFYLQQFIPENTLKKEYEKVEPYSENKLKRIRKRLKDKFGLKFCKIRNI